MSEQTPVDPADVQSTISASRYGRGRAFLVLALSLIAWVPYVLIFIFLPIHEAAMPYALAGIVCAVAGLLISRKPAAALRRKEPVQAEDVLYAGRYIAIAAIVIGVGLFGGGGEFGCAREKARGSACLSNVKLLTLAALAYVDDHDRYPDADRWVDELRPYYKGNKLLKCGDDTSRARCSYGMNAALSGKKADVASVPSVVVLVYETARPGANPHGGAEDAIRSDRDYGGNYIGYCDGHYRWVKGDQLEVWSFDPVNTRPNSP